MIDKDINDMQCWIFRHAQVKWGMTAVACAELFVRYGVFDFIEKCYDILHLSGYASGLRDVETYLINRGVKL